jgi:chemotaxis protein histidine kinase CheA
LDVTLASIVDSVPTLAKNLNKAEPTVSVHNGKVRIKTQSAATIKDIFTHLFRNCVDHGLESADERKANGKNAKGSIEVGITSENDNIRIAIKDDGRGLAFQEKFVKKLSMMVESTKMINWMISNCIADFPFRSVYS